jgi:hypothetical protein
MIPPFDENGYLPPGIHPATMEEIEDRFGSGTEIRGVLFESLVWLVAAATEARVLRVIVNGSYVTDTPDPNDVDCVLLVAENFDKSSAPARKLTGGCPFLSLELVEADAFQDMIEFFGSDRDDVPKGIIEVVP